MSESREDRRALILLISILLLIMVSPFAEGPAGEIVFAIVSYWILVAATIELSERKSLPSPSLILAVCAISAGIASMFHPARTILAVHFALTSAFFGYVCVVLFRFLGRPGKITSGRLYVSVSLYLLLGVFYFAVFNLLDTIHPGSFVEAGAPSGTGMTHAAHLYFSLVTLTTLGYGDIVPATPLARMLAVLEAATGVLYIAITVARLVAAYQRSDEGR